MAKVAPVTSVTTGDAPRRGRLIRPGLHQAGAGIYNNDENETVVQPRFAAARIFPAWRDLMQTEIEAAIENIRTLCDQSRVEALIPYLERAREWRHADALFNKLKSAPRIERLNDYLAEMKFGILFEDLGFQTEIVPENDGPTPDLLVARDGQRAFVEVKHFRRVPEGTPEAEKIYINQAFFKKFGSPERDVMKALLRIRDKYRQVRGREPGIIALWNDDEEIEAIEVGEAVAALVRNDRNIPRNLLFVLFGSAWVNPGSEQFLHCYPFGSDGAKAYGRWMRELEGLRSPGF